MNKYPSLVDAYEELEKLNVKVANCNLEETEAIATPKGLLAIDYRKITTQAQELEVLLHEVGHFETYAFYPKNSPHTVWQKQEATAARHVFEKYYPPGLLAAEMQSGAAEPWALAEVLGLPERFVREMLLYYVEVCGINFNTLAAPGPEETLPPPPTGQDEMLEDYLEYLRKTQGVYFSLAPGATLQDVRTAVQSIRAFAQGRPAPKDVK